MSIRTYKLLHCKLKFVLYSQFMQSMQIKYHEEAKQKGIHIVSACGFDSIPADMGLEILREKFPGKSQFFYVYSE